MISRRDFLQVGMAASALVGASGFGNWAKLAAQQSLTQDQLLQFDTFGNVSLIHVTDIHAQLKPIYFREPSVNIGVGENKGEVPHVTGADFRRLYGVFLIVNQLFQSSDRKVAKFLKFLIRLNLSNVDSRKNAEGNLTKLIIDVVDGIGG